MLLQEIQPQTIFSAVNVTIAIFSVLVLIGGALIVLMVKRRDTLQDTNERLIKAKDLENEDCEKRCSKCKTELESVKEELEDVTAEHRALTAITVGDLLNYARIREEELAKIGNLESQVRILKKQVDLHETDA